MKKWLAVAVLLWACPQVWGQACQPTPNASIGLPNYLILLPDEAAAQGSVTATLTAEVTNASGGVPSHSITVSAGGTQIDLTGASSNGISATLKFYSNGGTTPYYSTSVPLNGYLWTYTMQPSYAGESFQAVLQVVDQHGNTSQDRINIAVVAGSNPGIVFQDDFPTNYMLQLTIPFSGSTSMITNENCPNARNAIHSAPESGTFSNPTSGEMQSFTSAGNSFCSNCAFNENSPPVNISFLPGDAPPRTTTTDKLSCSLAGVFLTQIQRTGDSTQNQRVDKKMWTKVKAVQQAGDGGWYTQDWCIQAEPPIWSPNEIYSNLLPLYTYFWTAQTCSSSPPGTDPGPGWHCPPISGGPGSGNPEKFFPSHTGVKGSCNTNVNTPAPY